MHVVRSAKISSQILILIISLDITGTFEHCSCFFVGVPDLECLIIKQSLRSDVFRFRTDPGERLQFLSGFSFAHSFFAPE